MRGSGWHLSIFGEAALRRGDCLLLTPDIWHAYRGCESLELFNCCFRPSLVLRELAGLNHDAALSAIFEPASASTTGGPMHLHIGSGALAEGATHLEQMRALQWENGGAARLEMRGRFLLLLGVLARAIPPDERALWERATRWPLSVRDVVRQLENDLSHEWTLAELGELVHLDPTYFARLFRRTVGEAPLQYLTRRRAQTAAALLGGTALPIADIAARVGWPQQTYFARRFRAHFGCSAREFRRRARPA